MLAATDPANPFGASLPWPKREEARAQAQPRARRLRGHAGRRARALRRAGRQGPASPLREPLRAAGEPGGWLREALEALADHVRRGRIKRLGIERFDGEPVVGSDLEALLVEVGFRQGPRKLTLSA